MRNLIIYFSIICLAAISIQAQLENEEKLNDWTTEKVQRNPETEDVSSAICKVRVAENKGFDRVVVEFDDGKPRYVIQYLPSNIYPTDGGDHEIKITGNVFMIISIYGIGPIKWFYLPVFEFAADCLTD